MFRVKKLTILIIISIEVILSVVGCGNTTADNNTTISNDQVIAEENTTEEISEESSEEPIEDTTETANSREDESQSEAEEATSVQAEEETRLKAEEEEKQKAEEARLKAEEEVRQKAEEERIRAEQMNSYSMMNYLAITAEEIRKSRDNRLILDDIYTELLNDINPGAIDDRTQEHMQNLRDIINQYISISTKKERLQYIYNQNKAAAFRSAIPNPISILSMTNSYDWKKLALAATYSIVDSVVNYKNASDSADNEYLMSGWDLDDEELATIQKNRDRAFDYMVDMVQEYHLDGMQTLNEKAIENFVEICEIESAPEEIKRLEKEEDTYQLLGNYWLEKADCYFEYGQYKECLECVEKYNELSTGIYRKDTRYLKILPKAIASAQELYTGSQYTQAVSKYVEDIESNISSDDWSSRYYAAQIYLDLYAKTNNQNYIDNAYGNVSDNVTSLLGEQRKLNNQYLNGIVEETVTEPDYRYMTEDEKKTKEKEYKEEKERVKNYNKALKEERKTELPHLYEPLILNCELLFDLAEQKDISGTEKKNIEDILKTSTNGIFISKPINDFYSFTKTPDDYSINISKDKIEIPADLLTAESAISAVIEEKDNSKTEIDDIAVTKVERKGDTVDTFVSELSSKKFKKYKWTPDSKITVTITYKDAYNKDIQLQYEVKKLEEHWYGDNIEFGKT